MPNMKQKDQKGLLVSPGIWMELAVEKDGFPLRWRCVSIQPNDRNNSEDLNEMKIKILSERYEIIPTQVFKYVKLGKKTLFFIPKEVTSYKIYILNVTPWMFKSDVGECLQLRKTIIVSLINEDFCLYTQKD